MSYDRSEIARGRGVLQFGGESFFAKDEIVVRWVADTFKIRTANLGNVGTRDKDRYVTIQLTPTGRITTDLLGVMYPHLSKGYQAKALGTSDSAAVVYFEGSARKITVHNAVVYKMPDLNLRTGETVFGSWTLHGLVKDETEPHAADAFYTEASGVYPGDADFDVSEICAGMFSAGWGATAPWDEFHSENGFRVSFGVQLTPRGPDGTRRDYSVGDQTIQVTATPMGVGIDDVEAKVAAKFQGAGAPLGCVDKLANAEDLIISNADLYFCLYSADIENEGGIANPAKDEAGSLTWVADRTTTAGAANPIALIATAEPE